MTLYKKIINEAFDFSKVSTENRDKSLTNTMRDAVQKNVKISNILSSMSIPFMRGGKDGIDKDGMPVYWYGSKKRVQNKFETNKPINDYRNILRNGYNWQYFGHKDEGFKEILQYLDLYDEENDDAKDKCYSILISPDRGLIFVEFDTNNFYFDNNRYSFGFIIKQTGKVTYYVENDQKRNTKAQKIERNVDGTPILAFDEDTAFNLYVELQQVANDLREIDAPYYDAYAQKYEELQKKYRKILKKPGSFSKYDDPEYKKYQAEWDEWERWAEHEYKRDTEEYKNLEKRYREINKQMRQSLTKKEFEKINRNSRYIPEVFFKKYCPNKVFKFSMLKLK